MKLLSIWWDQKNNDGIVYGTHFSQKKDIIIDVGYIGVWCHIAMDIIKNFDSKLIIIAYDSSQKNTSGLICHNHINLADTKERIMHIIEQTSLQHDVESHSVTFNHKEKKNAVIQKKNQERLRRKHYKQWKITPKKKW